MCIRDRYYVVLTVLAVTSVLTASQRHHLPFEYAYLTNYQPIRREDLVMLWGWSLALEEQFYLTVPVLFFVLHKLRSDRVRLTLLGAFWASAFVVRLVIYLRGHDWTPATLYHAPVSYTHLDVYKRQLTTSWPRRASSTKPGRQAGLATPTRSPSSTSVEPRTGTRTS